MATITLDSIRDAIERKYQPIIIDMGDDGLCALRQALRLPESDRRVLADAQSQMSDSTDEDVIKSALRTILYLVAENDSQADKLVAWTGGELLPLIEIVQAYAEASQVGEASPSPS